MRDLSDLMHDFFETNTLDETPARIVFMAPEVEDDYDDEEVDDES
jgi:hypothetical protein